ncbi:MULTISPECIES: ATP-binding protein [Burkholderiales]|jgi:two-component system OmpR family sensor kinase|uniref:histidine kinase n=1 Tax=Burkholderia cenocepacia TaxID=95486 RepID=A0A6B2MEE6_9BURK|nr:MULTISPECIES: ATP-binding protein [Burkholderiaceae]NDV73900.1 two-component sensor histidine kinase [Burkholderia cenocepacia]
MDGFKERLKNSIRFQLAWSLSVAIVITALAAGAFSFYSAFQEAHELQDDILRQAAALVQHQPVAALSLMDLTGDRGRAHDTDPESNLIVQSLSEDAAKSGLPIPAALKDGWHTLQINETSYRVLIKTMANGQRIAVSQETKVRDEIAQDSSIRTILPLLILVPILLLVVTDLVRKMLRPVTRLAAEVDGRSEHDLTVLHTHHLPSEISPFVAAINRLLGRVGESVENQRRFVADAAHELRSPLTALSLQAERVEAAPMSDEARQRLITLRQGIDRGRNLLEQLLGLARAQSATNEPSQPVSVQKIYRHVLEDLIPQAEAKRIDIGIEGKEDAQVRASELDMITLVKNLVDNAIRYTPAGGRVDLGIRTAQGYAVLNIKDTGPGIPLSERERIFDAFYRTLGNEQNGSGLGLAIVQAIAKRIGAEIHLDFSNATTETGLNVMVVVPQDVPTSAASA